MLKERIIEFILRDLFGDDQSYRDTVTDCADSIMNCREMNDIRSALDSTMDVIADTHGYDDDGEIDDDIEPEASAADIFQDLCGIELGVAEALEHVGRSVDSDEGETMTCTLCGKVEAEHDAITRGWIPDYLDGEELKSDPVCVECCAAQITTNEDGDSILIKTAH